MHKITLTRKQANALEKVVESRVGGKSEVLMEHGNYCVHRPISKPQYWQDANESLNYLSFDGMALALYNGYEIEETPEDKLREYYEKMDYTRLDLQDPGIEIIKTVLGILNIKIEGVNA